jgi:adenosine deaminase
MNTAKLNKSIVDKYLMLLDSLSVDNKLEIISKLSESLKTKKKEKKKSISSLFGSLENDMTADELIKEIKEARNFSRKEIEL